MIALARRKKKKGSSRSQMLRMVMPMLSREHGEKLAAAIKDKNVTKLRHVWDQIKNDLSDKLAAEASAINKEASFEEAITKIFDDLFADLETAQASNRDLSSLFVGSSVIPRRSRELVANGRIELTDYKGDTLNVRLASIKVKQSGSPDTNPQVDVEAAVYRNKSRNRENTLKASGELGAACSEIAISALSLIESEG